MTKNLSGIWSRALIGRRRSYVVLAVVYERQTWDTKIKCKNDESTTTTTTKKHNIRRIYSSLKEAFESYCSSFAEDHKTLP